MPNDFFDPLQSIIESAKAKKVVAKQDPRKMKRDHMSTVGKMVLHTSARDREPFLTTNQMFARDVSVPDGHGEYMPPNPYKSWTNFDIITGRPRPPIFKEDRMRFADVDPLSRSSPWDRPDELELPRAQQSTQIFMRSYTPFTPNPNNPTGPVEWRSGAKLVDAKRRNERSVLPMSEKYARPVTAAQEMGWGLETDYKLGRVPPKEFHFGCARARSCAPTPRLPMPPQRGATRSARSAARYAGLTLPSHPARLPPPLLSAASRAAGSRASSRASCSGR